MNKNDFNSYLYTIMSAVTVQHTGCTMQSFSQHTITSKNMCFESMMCKMMML